eukprot:2666026-Prymnesium_polylepis.2
MPFHMWCNTSTALRPCARSLAVARASPVPAAYRVRACGMSATIGDSHMNVLARMCRSVYLKASLTQQHRRAGGRKGPACVCHAPKWGGAGEVGGLLAQGLAPTRRAAAQREVCHVSQFPGGSPEKDKTRKGG